MRLAISLALTVLLACGCANSPKREDLAVPSLRQTFTLQEPLSVVASVGIGFRAEYGAVPGTYTSERESNDGTYYFGEGRAIWHTHEALQKTPRLLLGGVFVPKASGQPPTLFYVFEKDVVTTQRLDEYVQLRIVQAAVTPTTGVPRVGMGTSVAGNVVGGALVEAIIDAGVGQLIRAPEPLAAAGAQKVAAAMRLALPAKDNASK